jgi:catechol 2,3-dioxygenase-like lactoylglutathione lyase family enzyme
MAIRQIHHVGIIVDDLRAATDYFVELGMQVEGEWAIEGDFVDRVVGIDGVYSNCVMLRTPDGSSRIELSKFDRPETPGDRGSTAAHALGIRHLCFNVDDVEDTLERLRPHGAELIGSLENYEDTYLTCYTRGPAGIIVELAQDLRVATA